jgi:hypothetical protein
LRRVGKLGSYWRDASWVFGLAKSWRASTEI